MISFVLFFSENTTHFQFVSVGSRLFNVYSYSKNPYGTSFKLGPVAIDQGSHIHAKIIFRFSSPSPTLASPLNQILPNK